MKKLLPMVPAVLCLLFLAGCSQPSSSQDASLNGSSSQAPQSVGSQSAQGGEVFVYPSQTKPSQTLVTRQTMNFEADGQAASIEVYTSAAADSKGNLQWDDGNWFCIQVVLGADCYTIFEEQYVQLGRPEVCAFTAADWVLHIVLTDARTAQYNVYDFVLDAQNHKFLKKTVLENTGVNVFGKI